MGEGNGLTIQKDLRRFRHGFLYCLFMTLMACDVALAGPSMPSATGFNIEDYASVVDPVKLSFDAAGNLYAGRDNRGSGGGDLDSVRISRVLPGQLRGGPLPSADWGPLSDDPDAVLVDVEGLFAPAGTTLVGLKRASTFGGRIRGVLPNGTALNPHVIADSTVFSDPGDMAFDPSGRLILTDGNPLYRHVVALQPAPQLGDRAVTETILFTLDSQIYPRDLAVGSDGGIFTSASNGSIYYYDGVSDERGGLVEYATGLGGGNSDAEIPLEFGPGDGVWGSSLYAMTGDGNLVRITENDGEVMQTIIGTGFGSNVKDIEFGPLNFGGEETNRGGSGVALYVSMYDDDKVIRIFVPEPATALLLLLAGAMRVRRLRRSPSNGGA